MKVDNPGRISTLLAAFTLGVAGIGIAHAQSEESNLLKRILLPAPTGPHAVGVTRFALEDSSRRDTLRLEVGPRRVIVSLWYPAESDTIEALHRRPYMDEATARALSENQGLPQSFHEAVVGHALTDPMPLRMGNNRWPVLLFSHGLSWPVAYYQTVLADLASRGHLIVAVEHTYGADPVVFPSGEVVPWGLFKDFEESIPDEALWKYLPTWRDDLLFVLSGAERGEAPSVLGRSVLGTGDFTRLGAFGHSYGGTAAILSAEASPAIIGAVNLEGGSFSPDPPYAVSIPTLFVIGGVNAATLAGTQFQSGTGTLLEAVVHGATHGTFSDLMILFRSYSRTMGPPGRIHPSRGATVTSALVAEYFRGLFEHSSVSELVKALTMTDVNIVIR